jgi:hypothetical protein
VTPLFRCVCARRPLLAIPLPAQWPGGMAPRPFVASAGRKVQMWSDRIRTFRAGEPRDTFSRPPACRKGAIHPITRSPRRQWQTGNTAITLAKRRRHARACGWEDFCSAICACWVIRVVVGLRAARRYIIRDCVPLRDVCRLMAHCCPEPMRQHVRSWRKRTLHRHRDVCESVSA